MKKAVWSILICLLLFFACRQAEQNAGNTTENSQENISTNSSSDTSLAQNNAHPNGPYTKKNKQGVIVEKGVFNNGQQDGIRYLYFDDGKIKTEEPYIAGSFEGLFKEYSSNGKLYQEGTYHNNSMTGVWKTYYDTGELKEEVMFVDNNENGPFRQYYKNGKVKYEGTYKDGNFEEGEMKLYNEEGILIKKLDCKKGKCNTIWVKKGYEDVKK